MKNSGVEWIGEIPEDWETIRNKRIMKKVKNICEHYNNENVLSLTMNGVIVRDLDNPNGKMPLTFDGYQYINENNLLMCLFDIDVTPRCVGIIKNNGVTSPAYSQFELTERADVNYFYYYYLYLDNKKELLHLSKNLRYSLTENQLGEILVPLPPKSTQQLISSYLDKKCGKIEETIQNQQQVIEKLKAYKQSLITEAVTGKIKIQNGKVCGKYESYKDSGVEWIGKIPNMWKKCKFGRIITDTRNGLSRRDLNKSIGNIVLKLKNISTDGNIDLSEINRIELTKTEIQTYKLLCNDFLFVRVNGSKNLVGKCAIYNNIEEIVAYNDHIIRVRFNLDLCNVYYIKFLLQSSYARYDISNHIKTAAGQFTISSEDLCNLICLLPTKDEQKEIANYLDKKCIAIDTAIEQKHKLIEKLTEYKKSLIYECVTGKKAI